MFAGTPPGVRELAVILRLAIVLHRSRGHEPLPHIEATAEEQLLTLRIPKDWRRSHPLTVEDLAAEAGYLQEIGVTLKVT